MIDWKEQTEQRFIEKLKEIGFDMSIEEELFKEFKVALGVAEEEVELQISLRETCIKVSQMQTKRVEQLEEEAQHLKKELDEKIRVDRQRDDYIDKLLAEKKDLEKRDKYVMVTTKQIIIERDKLKSERNKLLSEKKRNARLHNERRNKRRY